MQCNKVKKGKYRKGPNMSLRARMLHVITAGQRRPRKLLHDL